MPDIDRLCATNALPASTPAERKTGAAGLGASLAKVNR